MRTLLRRLPLDSCRAGRMPATEGVGPKADMRQHDRDVLFVLTPTITGNNGPSRQKFSSDRGDKPPFRAQPYSGQR
jgi:hypothetical protein